MPMVTVHYWAAARDAAGLAEEQVEAATVADLISTCRALRGEELGRVFERSSFLVDGLRASPGTPLADGAVVEVLPPFAGG